ncbi:hypothetical protein [Arthrobacter sp. D5-1]|uniref:hypothetical protein n=1 Tax=Arthrobacter sp. D5-1 TaxID=1477518 RepID=UPI001A98AAAC|nr:hypothetical protein [Arthrobacter sp. D5-1]
MGGNPEDIEKAKQEPSRTQGKVREELKASVEKLRAFTEAAGSDLSKYGDGQFEELMKPIQDWMERTASSRRRAHSLLSDASPKASELDARVVLKRRGVLHGRPERAA